MTSLFETLRSERGSERAADDALELMRELYPICRSITGDGVRRTLDRIDRRAQLVRTELPTGTPLFDWEVPREWNIRDAYIDDASGRRVVDFRAHSLHVVSYSVPVHCRLTLEQLQPHLYSLPERPDWIPYRSSYYRENWGFCLAHRERERLVPGDYDVLIDSDLKDGHMTYGEAVVAGQTDGEAVVYTHVCHPSLANDNLTGMAVAALLARHMRASRPRLTWRFVFGPGTLGSLAWLKQNEHRLRRLRGGLVIGLLGDQAPLTYKRSRRAATPTDRALAHVLRLMAPSARQIDFEPYGYDERQFCSPGFDLPVGRLTRSVNGGYPEYHTSADDLSIVRSDRLAESLRVLALSIDLIDANRIVLNLSGKGEPRLGKRGLYPDVGGATPGPFEQALLWVLSLSDGTRDLLQIAERSGLDFELIVRAAESLETTKLVRETS